MNTENDNKKNSNLPISDVMLRFDDKRNWVEDYKHENGKYLCMCYQCNRKFYGHKRRVMCKECSDKYDAS